MRHKFAHRLRGVGDLISKSGANIREIIINRNRNRKLQTSKAPLKSLAQGTSLFTSAVKLKVLAIVSGSDDTRSPSMKLSGRPESPLELRICLIIVQVLFKLLVHSEKRSE